MPLDEKKVSILTVIANAVLFLIKIVVGITFNTISLISDALNSLTDIIASAIVYFSIKVSHKEPDKHHQFGHTRSQPIAGFIVAVFTTLVGFEILRNSVGRIISGESGIPGMITVYTIFFVGAVKLGLLIITRKAYKETGSIALKANMVDHRNDIFIALIVFIGLISFNMGYSIADALAGIAISFYIMYSGYKIARENIDYMMGIAPSEETFSEIEKTALAIKGVKGLNNIRAHMLGTEVECEIHVYVESKLNIREAHAIGNKVRDSVQKLHGISRAYVHLDPYEGKKGQRRAF